MVLHAVSCFHNGLLLILNADSHCIMCYIVAWVPLNIIIHEIILSEVRKHIDISKMHLIV